MSAFKYSVIRSLQYLCPVKSALNDYFLRLQELETLLGEFGIQRADSESSSTPEQMTMVADFCHFVPAFRRDEGTDTTTR